MGVAPAAGAASVSIPLCMRKGSCCTTFSLPPRMRKWQASRYCITFSQLYLCDRKYMYNSPYQKKNSIFFSPLSNGQLGATRNLRVIKRQSAGHFLAVGIYRPSADGSFRDAGNTEGHHEKGGSGGH